MSKAWQVRWREAPQGAAAALPACTTALAGDGPPRGHGERKAAKCDVPRRQALAEHCPPPPPPPPPPGPPSVRRPGRMTTQGRPDDSRTCSPMRLNLSTPARTVQTGWCGGQILPQTEHNRSLGTLSRWRRASVLRNPLGPPQHRRHHGTANTCGRGPALRPTHAQAVTPALPPTGALTASDRVQSSAPVTHQTGSGWQRGTGRSAPRPRWWSG